MPFPRDESVKGLGQSGAEARASGPFAQTMVEPGEDPSHVHVEVIARNEIGAEKTLSFKGEAMDRGERAADARGRHPSGRPAQDAAPAHRAARHRSTA